MSKKEYVVRAGIRLNVSKTFLTKTPEAAEKEFKKWLENLVEEDPFFTGDEIGITAIEQEIDEILPADEVRADDVSALEALAEDEDEDDDSFSDDDDEGNFDLDEEEYPEEDEEDEDD